MICKDNYNFWKNKHIIKKNSPQKTEYRQRPQFATNSPAATILLKQRIVGWELRRRDSDNLIKNNEFHELNGLSCDARGILVGMHAAQCRDMPWHVRDNAVAPGGRPLSNPQ